MARRSAEVAPPARRRRFDQDTVTGVLTTAAFLLVGLTLLTLGHALRVVDDQLADFDLTHLDQ